MIGRRAWLSLAALAAVGARAADTTEQLLGQVRTRLADAPVLRGSFQQRRTIRGFRNPVVSHGDFLYVRDRGVLWHTRTPFESTLAVTRERLLSRQADGRVDSQLDARDQPALRAINEMLFALMSADVAALGQRFRVDGELHGPDAWLLRLAPRDATLGRWLTRVELEGDRFVRLVRLTEAMGDASEIRLRDHSTAREPTPDEVARLE